MENKIISVVVPVYNVERYLHRCLDSICGQSYQNLEIIVVNDGSTDDSLSICQAYAAKDKRIKVISKHNGGLSTARNSGIEASSGEYIAFVDSDDFISIHYLERLYAAIQETGCLIAQCGIQPFSKVEECTSGNVGEGGCQIIPKMEFLQRINQSGFCTACNKLYEKSLFDTIRFPEGRIHEDMATTFKIVDLCETVACVNEKLYYYFSNPTGITKSKISVKHLDLVDAYWEQVCHYHGRTGYAELAARASNDCVSSLITLVSYPKSAYVDFAEFRKAATDKTVCFADRRIKKKWQFQVLCAVSPKNLIGYRLYGELRSFTIKLLR